MIKVKTGIEKLYERASEDHRNQRLIKAIKEAIKEEPDNYKHYYELAYVYEYIGDYDKQLGLFKQIIKYYPKGYPDLDIHYGNLAMSYIRAGMLDKAKLLLDKALLLNPKNSYNHWHLLTCYTLKGLYEEAALEMKILSDLNPGDDCYYDIYRYILDKDEDLEKMANLFRKAVKVNPNSHLSRRMLAIALRNNPDSFLQNLPIVMKEFKKALKLNPKYLPTYISIADTYMLHAVKVGNKAYFKKALKWFNKAQKIDPNNIRLFYAMGNCYVYMGEYDKGIEKLEYVISRGLRDVGPVEVLAKAYNNKAYDLYIKGEDLEEGLEMINKAIRLVPDNGIILGTKAEILYKMERHEEAYEYIQRALVLEPNHLEMKQDLENIENALKRAKIEPNSGKGDGSILK